MGPLTTVLVLLRNPILAGKYVDEVFLIVFLLFYTENYQLLAPFQARTTPCKSQLFFKNKYKKIQKMREGINQKWDWGMGEDA